MQLTLQKAYLPVRATVGVRKTERETARQTLTETDLVIMTTMNEQYIHLNLHQLRPQLLNTHT